MFPQTHKIVAEYCLTHTMEECANFVVNLWFESLLIVLVGFGVAGLICLGYYLYQRYKKIRKR